MKISIYRSAFNLVKNNFQGWEESIFKSCDFADEVVIAVNTSSDGTLELIKDLGISNLVVLECDIPYSDPLLDGKLKNEALQKCSGDILIQLDLDEYIPKWQKSIWIKYAESLKKDFVSCYMIPCVDIYGDLNHYKSIGNKWYLHKRGLNRGPVNFARKEDGTVDTHKSDTCELINSEGNLLTSKIVPNDISLLETNKIPFVVHLGYLDFSSRINRNKEFWGEHWIKESGGEEPPHKIHLSIDDFDEQIFEHNLNL